MTTEGNALTWAEVLSDKPPARKWDLPPPNGHAHLSLGAMLMEQENLARSVADVGELVLAQWWLRQFDAQAGHTAMLIDAYRKSLDWLADKPPDHPRWDAFEMVDARLRYAGETLERLRDRRHVLVCPVGGIAGVPREEVVAALGRDDELVYAALSLRGLITDEGRTAWERYSERVAMGTWIEAEAKQLRAERLRPAGPRESFRGFRT